MNRRKFIQTAAMAASSLPALLEATPAQSEILSGVIKPDTDGMLSVRGKREFIVGLYQLPKQEDALRAVREAGFNLVLLGATPAEYDAAHAVGLRGWSSLGSIPPATRADAEAGMRKTIEALRDHPALLFWETADEPTYVWKEPLKQRVSADEINATAAFIRGLDPTHPLYLNHSPTNLVPTLQAYNPASDIVATDIYPVIPHGIRESYALWPDGRQGDFLNSTISQVGDYADKMRAVAGPQRAVFMVLQAFAWEMLREKDRDPKMVLYPNAAQLRFMAWQAIAHGVNGLIWWGLNYAPPEAPMWNDLKTVVRELTQVQEALAAPAAKLPIKLTYHDTGHSLDRGMEWIAKPLEGGMLLAAVNADSNPVDVSIGGLNGYQKCEAMFDKRPVARNNGQLRELFEPFGTRVWRLS